MTKRVLNLILPILYFYKCQIIQGLHDSWWRQLVIFEIWSLISFMSSVSVYEGAHNYWPLGFRLSSYSDANKIIPNFCSTTVSLILGTLYWFKVLNRTIYKDIYLIALIICRKVRVVPSALYLYILWVINDTRTPL